jgi:hypothetical protein
MQDPDFIAAVRKQLGTDRPPRPGKWLWGARHYDLTKAAEFLNVIGWRLRCHCLVLGKISFMIVWRTRPEGFQPDCSCTARGRPGYEHVPGCPSAGGDRLIDWEQAVAEANARNRAGGRT